MPGVLITNGSKKPPPHDKEMNCNSIYLYFYNNNNNNNNIIIIIKIHKNSIQRKTKTHSKELDHHTPQQQKQKHISNPKHLPD